MNHPPAVEMASSMQLLRWIMQPPEFLENCAGRYGDCFEVNLGLRQLVFFSQPDALERILTAGDQFDSGRANVILQRTLGDNSVLLLDGDRHKRQRQLLMPPFHGERMRAYGELICQVTEQATSQWQANQSFAVRPFMQEISLRVMLQAVFGLEQGQRYEQIKQLLCKLLDLAATRFGFASALLPILQLDFGSWSPAGRFNRLKQQIDDLLYAEIHARREDLDCNRTDILSLLLAARDEAGQPMSDQELRDELMTLLLAGHETTATALSWALYWIHLLPEVKTKLLVELDELERLDAGAISRLPYLNAVCSETLRIYPVAMITSPRIAKAPIQVTGYEFQPEDILVPCIYLTHQREDLYPDPKRFKPERFLERQFSPYEFLPFGGSNRRCIGAAFALFEMKLALVTILKRYDLVLEEKRRVVPVRRGVTIAPKGGIKMRLIGQRRQLAARDFSMYK